MNNHHGLKKRTFKINTNNQIISNDDWFCGHLFKSHLLNSYNLLVPDGEKFIIRNCKHYFGKLSPELKDEAKTFFYQEGTHSREHERLLFEMQKIGLGMNKYRKLVNGVCYRILEPLVPHKLRLSIAVGIEYYNALIAIYFLKKNLLDDIHIDELRRLLSWHFIEDD